MLMYGTLVNVCVQWLAHFAGAQAEAVVETGAAFAPVPYVSVLAYRRGKTWKSTARMAMQVAIISAPRNALINLRASTRASAWAGFGSHRGADNLHSH